jgi:hypothetical protein
MAECCNRGVAHQEDNMIKAYSQRLSPPFSGQAQIAESDRARAITLDGQSWEVHFLKGGSSADTRGYHKHQRSYLRAAYVNNDWIRRVSEEGSYDGKEIDERILELARFLADAALPFPVADVHEYWLLDAQDKSPLALIFTCVDAEQMSTFPEHPEWTALPAAVMPIERSDEELACGTPPVNYQVERLVAERAGSYPKARWFRRSANESVPFPPLLLREDWQDQQAHELCQRYLRRQSPRLLMLHGLEHDNRLRLERAARANVMEVARFYPVYPEIADPELMNAIRVEARIRGAAGAEEPAISKRRDGVLYL